MNKSSVNTFCVQSVSSSSASRFNLRTSNMRSAGTSTAQPKREDLSFLSRQPPPGFVYFTFAVALVGLITNFFGFVIKRFDRLVDRIYVLKQDYWNKTFLMPVCLEPLRDFVLKSSTNLNNISKNRSEQHNIFKKNSYRELEYSFKDEKDKLINQFLILHSFNPEVYSQVSDKIDELEDIVVKHCYANSCDVLPDDEYYAFKFVDSVNKEMFNILSQILIIISKNHDNLFIDKKTVKQLLLQQIKRFEI